MGKTATPKPEKLTQILKYFHQSGTAHSIKDLEKALPSIASINSMQVKDYLQSLSDEGQIRVEKIGSGNWYWAFLGEEKRAREAEVEKAKKERDGLMKEVGELKGKVEKEGKRITEEEDVDGEGMDRTTLSERAEQLKKEVEGLKTEVEKYDSSDSVMLRQKKNEVGDLKIKAEKWTDDIYCMESFLTSKMGLDRSTLSLWKRETYGDEFDEEVDGLREIE